VKAEFVYLCGLVRNMKLADHLKQRRCGLWRPGFIWGTRKSEKSQRIADLQENLRQRSCAFYRLRDGDPEKACSNLICDSEQPGRVAQLP
jgi:hypothetical protein